MIRFFAASAFAADPSSLTAAAPLAPDLVVDFLDVGQGDAIVIRDGAHTALVDAGDVGSPTVADLLAMGVKRLDLVVATHPHEDHVGEMADVLRAFPVGLYLDDGIDPHTRAFAALSRVVAHTRHRTARAGFTYALGKETTLTVLLPGRTRLAHDDPNTNSVVLRVDHGLTSFLLTGDATAATESVLLDADLAPADVLKVAHHGSDHSSTAAFLTAIQPRYAVISCGVDNPYGHPGDGTLERLMGVGAEVHRTDREGTIEIESDGHTLTVRDVTLTH